MKQHSETKENYLKCIWHHSKEGEIVSNKTISGHLGTSPASVTDMIRKLSKDGLVIHESRRGVRLTEKGKRIALSILRKHRLWELFLVETLGFTWDSVHEIAEQLEHVQAPELIRRIDEYLGYPKYDPHGDPIPNEEGIIESRDTVLLSEAGPNQLLTIVSVRDSDPDFLQYLDRVGLTINQKVLVVEKLPFDDSLQLEAEGKTLIISGLVAKSLNVLTEEPVSS
jgi:DtxR family Mn-dependent transcriptional regulator